MSIFQSSVSLIPSITQHECRQSIHVPSTVHPRWIRERAQKFLQLPVEFLRSLSALLAAWDPCSFCAYMPNVRLATRKAEHDASTKTLAPPTHYRMHSHSKETGKDQGKATPSWSIWGRTWSDQNWRESKLVDVMRAARSCKKILRTLLFPSFFFFFYWDDTVKTSQWWLKICLRCSRNHEAPCNAYKNSCGLRR